MKGIKMMCISALMAGCTAAPDLEQQIDELYGKMSTKRDNWTQPSAAS